MLPLQVWKCHAASVYGVPMTHIASEHFFYVLMVLRESLEQAPVSAPIIYVGNNGLQLRNNSFTALCNIITGMIYGFSQIMYICVKIIVYPDLYYVKTSIHNKGVYVSRSGNLIYFGS